MNWILIFLILMAIVLLFKDKREGFVSEFAFPSTTWDYRYVNPGMFRYKTYGGWGVYPDFTYDRRYGDYWYIPAHNSLDCWMNGRCYLDNFF